MISKIITIFHKKIVHSRREQALAIAINQMIIKFNIKCSSLLDVGCGDGTISSNINSLNTNKISLQGVEFLPRGETKIPVVQFDGVNLPFPSGSFDVVLLCDVLHHIPSKEIIVKLLKECARVGKHGIILKDHPIENGFDRAFISAMDWFGNYGQGIPLPFNFPSRAGWEKIFLKAGLKSSGRMEGAIGVHPKALRFLTEAPFWSKPFHFIEYLTKESDCD